MKAVFKKCRVALEVIAAVGRWAQALLDAIEAIEDGRDALKPPKKKG